MRNTLALFAILGFLWCVTALPATSKQIDDGIEFVKPKQTYGDQPIVDTGAGFEEGPFGNPFGGLFDNIENLMTRVRQQMNDLLRRFPGVSTGNSSEEDFPGFPVIGGFPKIDLDLGKGNTTSVTKIIDGHKVVINQTEYHKDDDLGSSFFKVRIIDFQPQDAQTEKDAEEVTPSSVVPKDRESLENTLENEIIKNKEAISYHRPLETFDHVDSPRRFMPRFAPIDHMASPQRFIPRFAPAELSQEWDDFNSIAPVNDNSINFEPLRDLSRDTYVNELLAKSGATPNPDAEIIEVVPQGSRRVPMQNFEYTRIPR